MLLTSAIPPNQTLFCTNLNSKIHSNDLKACLFELFCSYGRVIDVVASKKDPKKRGNGFVVFAEIASATNALRALQGFVFLGRPLILNYAKAKSDVVALADGTFKPRKRNRSNADIDMSPFDCNVASLKPSSSLPSGGASKAARQIPGEDMSTLFIENLPDVMTDAALNILFKQYPGFLETRLIEGRGVAFIDYNNELQAEVAKRGLDGFLVTPECALKISYAKK